MLRKRRNVIPMRRRLTVRLRPTADKTLHSKAIAMGTTIAAITALTPKSSRMVMTTPPIFLGSRLCQALVQELPMGNGPKRKVPAAKSSNKASRANDQRQNTSSKKITGSRHMARKTSVMGLGGLVISPWESGDHHVHRLARHNNHLGDLLAFNGGADFFVGEDALAHYIFRALRGQDHVAAKLTVDLDGISSL